MMRRMFAGRHRRMWLVALSVFCACVLLIWDREPTSRVVKEFRQSWQREQQNQDQFIQDNGNIAAIHTQTLHITGGSGQKVNPCNGSPWRELVSVPSFLSSPVISLKHSLLYCPVGKVGSTYFTRVMISLGLPRPAHTPLASPFTIPITQAGRDRCNSLDSLKSPAQKLAFLQKSELMVFGRDPYRRIFSAWLDKLYSPNPFYWRKWGLQAARTKGHARCNSNVTFAQFVRLVVRQKGLHATDVHLRPVAEECKMCDLHYTLVGKIETASKDLEVLASRINVSMAFLREADYREANAVDTVLDAVGGAFSWRDEIEACGVSLDRMGRSIWRKLQIRGVFDVSQQYPFKPEELRGMAPEEFIDACKVAIKTSSNKARLKQQKELALLQAYSQVDIRDLAKVAQVYRKDFLIFGYDEKPDILFSKRNKASPAIAKIATETTDAFDWSKEWVL